MRSYFHALKAFLLAAFILLLAAACAPAAEAPGGATGVPSAAVTLRPYHTPTASQTPTPLVASATPLPSATPTPRTHTIAAGEDLGGIAFAYRVSVQAILEINPGIDPNFLSVGTQIQIPASQVQGTGEAPAPTPVTVNLSPVHCSLPGPDGVWCFTLVTNPQERAVESVSAEVRVAGQGGSEVSSEMAYAPLNQIPAGAALPLAAHFENPPDGDLEAGAELKSSLPVPAESGRYLPARVDNLEFSTGEGGLSAVVSGGVVLEEGSGQHIWVVVWAYDAAGNVTGLRRWESQTAINAGESLPFNVNLYSSGGDIVRVDALAEIRP